MKTLTFQIPDEIYELLSKVAADTGRNTDDVALEWLASTAPKDRPKLTKAERKASLERLLRHAGAVDSGDPRSADNERIDEDLAREYGSAHEGE